MNHGQAILALQQELKAKMLEIKGLNDVNDRLVQRKKEAESAATSLARGIHELDDELKRVRDTKAKLESELASAKIELYSTLDYRARHLWQEVRTAFNTLVDRAQGR